MARDLDTHLQRIIDNATGLDAQKRPAPAFNFPAMETRAAEWSFRPAPRQSMQEPKLFNDYGRDPYGYESPEALVAPSTTTTRLSLAPRNIYNQQGERESRAITNADHHFRFAQNLRQGLPVSRPPQTTSNTQAQSPLSQLATSMLLQRPIPETSPEHTSIFHGLRSNRLHKLQPQRQQVTPPFNLSGFAYSPNTQQTSIPSSPPLMQYSSPTTRVSLRRLSNRTRASSGYLEEDHDTYEYVAPAETPQRQSVAMIKAATNSTPQALALEHAPPMAHGIQLISPYELPDRFRQIFPYQLFNAAQSKCFASVYKSNDNVVVSAPTGCGKTAILELAICKLIEGHPSGEFKIVYQAPTRSLCSERMRDWHKKFSHLNLPCAELTGDTSQFEMSRVRNASIIVTTPEKWDSITRKWQDHIKLLQMVKLFLIDEVHILKDTRGATLEAVVSRMKSIGANVRFVALSATVPNSEDIALWLGRDPTNTHLPAHRETFGEDFRPVKLQKHVYGFDGQMNDFAFEKVLDGKLPNLIQKHTSKKPIMVFCFTRKSCEGTAATLAEWWTRQRVVDRSWPAPVQQTVVGSRELQVLVGSGVAFHHAGLDSQDRNAIETAFLKGDISVICCTSTLAVGVNLPCHLVVLKGTVGFQDGGLCEYSDLEVMQMLGRAGRPQFDDSAIAIIMTRSDKVDRYKKMISGQDILESTLHLNLIGHLNSEIGLGTIHDLDTAKRWLSKTFLSVRMRQNPSYYKLEGIPQSTDADERLRLVCERDVKLLQENQLVSEKERFMCTEYGHAMSRYMVQFETMKLLLSLPRHAKTEQILQLICQASEFKDLRMKPNERPSLREFNKSPFIKYPIKENISTTSQKISLIIQVQLGGVDLPTSKDFQAIKRQFMVEKGVIFERIQRLIRCIIDCKSVDCDAISTRHALDLARSLSAGFWENSNLQLRQIPQVGPAATRKLVSSNINSVEKLASLDTASIERIMGRNPPFGRKLLDSLLGFPRLTLQAETSGRAASKAGENPRVYVKAKLGFANAKAPVWKERKPSLTFMAETSDGTLVHFWRGNIQKLDKVHELKFIVELSCPDDEIKCYVACDEIVGTARSSLLKPDIPASAFPAKKPSKQAEPQIGSTDQIEGPGWTDEFGGDDIEDDELLEAVKRIDAPDSEYGSDDFADIDDFNGPSEAASSKEEKAEDVMESVLMENGKWTCNHRCCGGQTLKNGQPCKHKCCHEGLDKPRKPRRLSSLGKGELPGSTNQIVADRKQVKKSQLLAGNSQAAGGKTSSAKSRNINNAGTKISKISKGQMKLKECKSSHSDQEDVEVIDLAEELPPVTDTDLAPRDYRKLQSLHTKVQKENEKPVRLPKQKPGFSYASGQQPNLQFLHKPKTDDEMFDSWGFTQDEDFPSPSALTKGEGNRSDPFEIESITHEKATPSSMRDGSFESLEAAMLGLHDSERPKTPTPKIDLSFENGVFDFSSFNDQPEQREIFSSPSMQTSLKRPLSLTPEMPDMKYRRVKKDESITKDLTITQTEPIEHEETQQRTIPAWVDEFDSALINDLKGIVDFVD